MRADQLRLGTVWSVLAFEHDVQYDRALGIFGKARVNHKVARFRQVNIDKPNVHHDALEFPGGEIVMVTRLVAGQTVTVLQLPVQLTTGAKDSQRQAAHVG